MQELVKRYAEEVRGTQGVNVQIRVGLNSGEVIVRAINSDLRMDYTAIGRTTHLAARMEQLASPGGILLTPATLELAEGFVAVNAVGPVAVKGLSSPTEVYELTGAGQARTRLQAAAARGFTRFIGRDIELEQLHLAMEQACGGHGQVVAVVGEPGVGKSRLFWEFTHSHRLGDWLLLESSSLSFGQATSFLPLVALLRAYFQLEAGAEAPKIRDKVMGKLVSLEPALEPILPALLWLLDVPVEEPRWQRLDPPQRRQQALDAIKRLLLRECQVQPLLLLFEDLHWIDAETQAFLDILVDAVPGARVLVLVNYRPEYRHAWGSKTCYRQLRIDPLKPASAGALIETMLGTDESLQPLKQALHERTEGNPFFLEESVRTLVETKALMGEPGAYRLAPTFHTLQIPPTAHAILAGRIDRLAPEEKRLLQAASAIGKDLPFPLLQAVADDPHGRFRNHLASLQAAEFLYEARIFPDLEYTFKHALTHEVAYGSLVQQQRRMLHGQILEAIERLYSDRMAENLERLAHHAFRGEAWQKAVAYCSQAGAKAMARSANREAANYLEQALSALSHLPEGRDTLAQAIDLRIELRHALWPLGEIERTLEHLRTAETLAEALGDERRLARVLSVTAYSFWMRGDFERIIIPNRRALAIATRLGDFALAAPANFALGLAYHGLGQYRQAIRTLDAAIASLQGEHLYGRFGTAGHTSVLSIMALAWSHSELGSFVEGIARGEEGIRIAQAVDHPLSRMFADLGIGQLYLARGDLAHAIPTLERGLATCRTWDFPSWLPWLASRAGAAFLLAGRVAEAMPLLEESIEQAASMGWRADASFSAARLSEAYLVAGRTGEASAWAARALEAAVTHKSRGHQAWAVRLLGDIASVTDAEDPLRAEGHYRQALAIATELDMRPLVGHCHFGLARLHGRIGKREEMAAHFARAASLYGEMDMEFWRDQAELAMATSPEE
jgi:tetratricopeptide (TPR) repeat protein